MSKSHPERVFQIQLVRDLRAVLAHGVFLTAFPAEGSAGGRLRGAFLKASGLVPGVPDLMFIHEGRVFFMELKAKRGKLSVAQDTCICTLINAGALVATVRTLDEALAAIEDWQLPTRIKQQRAA